MPAFLQMQSDAAVPITSWNMGAIDGGTVSQQKFLIENTGSDPAEDVEVSADRLVQNDGVDFAEIALDAGGNPGTYQTAPLLIGTVAPGQVLAVWLRITVPFGTSPAGNQRLLDFGPVYNGT